MFQEVMSAQGVSPRQTFTAHRTIYPKKILDIVVLDVTCNAGHLVGTWLLTSKDMALHAFRLVILVVPSDVPRDLNLQDIGVAPGYQTTKQREQSGRRRARGRGRRRGATEVEDGVGGADVRAGSE